MIDLAWHTVCSQYESYQSAPNDAQRPYCLLDLGFALLVDDSQSLLNICNANAVFEPHVSLCCRQGCATSGLSLAIAAAAGVQPILCQEKRLGSVFLTRCRTAGLGPSAFVRCSPHLLCSLYVAGDLSLHALFFANTASATLTRPNASTSIRRNLEGAGAPSTPVHGACGSVLSTKDVTKVQWWTLAASVYLPQQFAVALVIPRLCASMSSRSLCRLRRPAAVTHERLMTAWQVYLPRYHRAR